MVDIEIRGLKHNEMGLAAGVLSRGMRDNPIHIAVFGDEPRYRIEALMRLYRSYLPLMKYPPLSAWRGVQLVGVLGLAPAGTCQLPVRRKLRLLPAMLRGWRPGVVSRAGRWERAWRKHDLQERHWHLGPGSVEPELQGMGIGSQMMQYVCARMDAEREVVYLETDRPENVRFYGRCGFETVGEAMVLGKPNWFMRRPPAGS